MEDSRYPTKCLSALSLVHTGGCQKKGKEIKHRNDACVSSSCQICCSDSKRRSVTPHTRYLYPGLYPPFQGYIPSPSMYTWCDVAHLCQCFIQGCCYCCNYILLFWEWEDCFHWCIGALQRACWDSWTRHVTLRILGLMNHATHVIANAYIFTFEICWVWLILVKFLCNLFSKVCRFIKRPSALLPSCMPCCILCLPSADPFITLFFEVTPKGRGHNCQTPADFLLSGDPWHLALEGAWAGGWESLLFPVCPTSSSSWVVLQGAGEMICMYVHVWCLQRMFVGLTAAKMNDGIIDSFRMQLLTRFLCPALVQRCCG